MNIKYPTIAVLIGVISLSAEELFVPAHYVTIQAAIDASVDGDEVTVSPGTYVENIDFSGKNITVRSDSGRAETIIDGNASGSTVTFNNQETENAILDGFTIQNGSGWYNGAEFIGGGILIRESTGPTLRNLIVKDNRAISGTDGSGGGIIISLWSYPTLENIVVSNNEAGWGGGILIYYSAPILNNVKIINNTANTTGGGLYIGDYSITEGLNRLTICDNYASYFGGGIFVNNNATVTFNHTTVARNRSEDGGSGMIVCDGCTVHLVNSIFYWNIPDQIQLYDAGQYESSTLGISYSDVQGGEAGIDRGDGSMDWGEGNITEDPLFIYNSCSSPIETCPLHTVHEDNFNLMADSPCFEAARDGDNMGALAFCLTLATEPDPAIVPRQFELYQNYPNPFNPSTTLSFDLPVSGWVTLRIYDLQGKVVATLNQSERSAGSHSVNWSASDPQGQALSAGIYLYEVKYIDSNGRQFHQVRKFTLLN